MIGPTVIPFSFPANVIFSEIVLAFVRIIELVPNDGPPSTTSSCIFAFVTASSASSAVVIFASAILAVVTPSSRIFAVVTALF